MTTVSGKIGEATQSVAHAVQFKPQSTAFSEKVIDFDLKISARAHVALPGQGKATATSFELSSLA